VGVLVTIDFLFCANRDSAVRPLSPLLKTGPDFTSGDTVFWLTWSALRFQEGSQPLPDLRRGSTVVREGDRDAYSAYSYMHACTSRTHTAFYNPHTTFTTTHTPGGRPIEGDRSPFLGDRENFLGDVRLRSLCV
jgi:hypothetical protein